MPRLVCKESGFKGPLEIGLPWASPCEAEIFFQRMHGIMGQVRPIHRLAVVTLACLLGLELLAPTGAAPLHRARRHHARLSGTDALERLRRLSKAEPEAASGELHKQAAE